MEIYSESRSSVVEGYNLVLKRMDDFTSAVEAIIHRPSFVIHFCSVFENQEPHLLREKILSVKSHSIDGFEIYVSDPEGYIPGAFIVREDFIYYCREALTCNQNRDACHSLQSDGSNFYTNSDLRGFLEVLLKTRKLKSAEFVFAYGNFQPGDEISTSQIFS